MTLVNTNYWNQYFPHNQQMSQKQVRWTDTLHTSLKLLQFSLPCTPASIYSLQSVHRNDIYLLYYQLHTYSVCHTKLYKLVRQHVSAYFSGHHLRCWLDNQQWARRQGLGSILIRSNKMQLMQVFIYCKITLHVSGVYRTHHQEYIKL